MAGAGFKTFSAGAVLTAAEVNTYLMQQAVMVFGGTAARSSAVPTPSEGMVTYLSDLNDIQAYDGSNWISTGLTAGTTTANYGWPIPASGSIASLGTAIDTTVAGLGSGLNLINSTTFTSLSTVSVNNVFNSTYKNYRLLLRIDSTIDYDLKLRFRTSGSDNTNNNYTYAYGYTTTTFNAGRAGGTATASILSPNTTANGLIIALDIYTPFATENTYFSGIGGCNDLGNTVTGSFNTTTSFDGFSLLSTGTALTGYMKLYGYQN